MVGQQSIVQIYMATEEEAAGNLSACTWAEHRLFPSCEVYIEQLYCMAWLLKKNNEIMLFMHD